MQSNKFRSAPPNSSAMIETLRGLGYSTGAALADIIDNSISARAKNICLKFIWRGAESSVLVVDDGDGMNDAELESAMRLGDKNPTSQRNPNDLGRFGIGLKSASFSQCRRLTVGSMKDGLVSCLRWDLDYLANNSDGGWHLLEGADPRTGSLIVENMPTPKGTVVLWEAMDRIVTPGFTEQEYLDLIDKVEQTLGMIFHRFIEGSNPRLRLTINDVPVKPWDPFMSNNSFTMASPEVPFKTTSGVVKIRGYVLPHNDQLTDEEYERWGGPDGWNSQQGFYVYRNDRLLVSGGWLGLGGRRAWTREESHRLARISIEITNTSDVDWKIDIRKSIARPPLSVRPMLIKIAEDTRAKARRVFAHRGLYNKNTSKEVIHNAWRSEVFKGGIRYRIDTEHPAIKSIIESSGELSPQIKALLRIIEETVPVQKIWLDTAEAKETPRTAFAEQPSESVVEVLTAVFEDLTIRRGMSKELAKNTLLSSEPFNHYPNLISNL
jgi:hypothetical protein